MRGFPLVNFLLTLSVLVALAAPLVSLSRDAARPPLVRNLQPEGTQLTQVSVRLAHAATEASLWRGQQMLHTWPLPQPSTEFEATVNLPHEGALTEFEIRLTWPAGTPQTLAEITVEPPGLASRSQNVWGTGHAAEVLTFTWK